MATRSTIGLILDEKSALTVYCHWDGYPDHHLPILEGYYNTVDKVKALLALGSISVLDKYIGEQIDFDDYEGRNEREQCLFYGRDRGERNTRAQRQAMRDAIGDNDYTYLFDPSMNQWRVWDYNSKELTKKKPVPKQASLDLGTDPANGGV